MIWRFTIPGQPIAKGRGRAVRRGASVAVITPERTRAYEAKVEHAAAPEMGAARIEGPLSVQIVAFFERPGRLMRKRDPDGSVPHTSRPDADNVAKAVCDGMSAWFDDACVCDLRVLKRYAEKGGVPRCEVVIREVVE